MAVQVNYSNAFGTNVLARLIQKYWHDRGFTNVQAERVQVPESDTYVVRSNLVNGLPPKDLRG